MTQAPVPISEAQARAIEATAKATEKAAHVLEGFGGYLKEVFGTAPHDLVGYFGGDYLKIARAENIVRLLARSKEIHNERQTEPEPISISVSLPLLVAAADESRDELVELWARLLAAAGDPMRSKSFRMQFIEIAKKMDPLDAAALNAIGNLPRPLDLHQKLRDRQNIASSLGISPDQFSVSLLNLTASRLVTSTTIHDLDVTPLGREFLRAVN